jgi:hypothetical protein
MIGLHHFFLEMSKNVGQDSVSGIVHKEAFTRGVVGAIFAIYTSGRTKNTFLLC